MHVAGQFPTRALVYENAWTPFSQLKSVWFQLAPFTCIYEFASVSHLKLMSSSLGFAQIWKAML